VSALNYAVQRNRACCARLVDVGGMKYVFPLLTGGWALCNGCVITVCVCLRCGGWCTVRCCLQSSGSIIVFPVHPPLTGGLFVSAM
jgi:hypothetical protein